jgi:hypothetical protein
MKKEEELKFRIGELRKDKMIYALESIATSIALLIFLFGVGVIFPRFNPILLFVLVASVTFGYWVFMMIGNLRRFREIRKLEKTLYGKK